MRRRVARAVLAVVVALVAVVSLNLPPVAAQDESPPQTFPQPTSEPTSEGSGPESTAGELRAAQIGLIAVAVVGLALVVVYWRHTGREARARFERERPRHMAERRSRRGEGGSPNGGERGDVIVEDAGTDG